MDKKQSPKKEPGLNLKKGALPILALALAFFKSSIKPFLISAKFVKEDLQEAASHDAKLIFFIGLFSALIFILAVLLWITLGAGGILVLILQNHSLLIAWLWTLAFEVGSILLLILLIIIFKKLLKTPDSIERAKKIFKS